MRVDDVVVHVQHIARPVQRLHVDGLHLQQLAGLDCLASDIAKYRVAVLGAGRAAAVDQHAVMVLAEGERIMRGRRIVRQERGHAELRV